MARYGAEHKETTRRRIIERAGRRFKSDGVERSGIAALMADADLTNGAFYAHFASKDDLVATVVSDQMESQRERFRAEVLDGSGLEAYLRYYLSRDHRDHPDEGCPSAALLEDIARGADATKRAYTDGIVALAEELAGVIDASPSGSARVRALSVFAAMIGTLQVARAIADDQLADEVLSCGIDNAIALLGQRRHPD